MGSPNSSFLDNIESNNILECYNITLSSRSLLSSILSPRIK